MFFSSKDTMVTAERALSGRPQRTFVVPERHAVNGELLQGPYAEGAKIVDVGLGCFWGAERVFWQMPGVLVTLVGYAGGYTPNPTYEEVCTGQTGHAEVVRVVYDPAVVSLAEILQSFYEAHDPTQGMRQGNDRGTQYRSVIYVHDDADLAIAEQVTSAYDQRLRRAGFGPVTTEVARAGEFYPAEDYHQQYLYKVPNGYCGLAGTGVSCPVGLGVAGDVS
jgi:peptide-methionine (S)-S-oxide reductase